MKATLKNLLAGYLGLFVLVLFVSPWTQAQENNKATVNSNANSSTAEVKLAAREKGTWLTFGLDRVEVLKQRKLAGIALWQYLASLIYIFLALYISKFLDYFTRAYLKKWVEKTETKLDDLLIGLIDGPIKVILFVILLHIGVTALEWPPTVRTYLSRALTVVVAVSLTYAAVRGLDLLVTHWRRRAASELDQTFNDQFLPFIRTILRIFIIVVAGLITLEALQIRITGLITGLGIGGLAFALAAQDTVANLFGAVAVFADKPFQVGDAIRVDNVEGVVETIGLRSTRVRHPDGHLITVPNKTMGNATITNITRRPHIKTTMNIGITYDTPTHKVRQAIDILEEVYRQHPMTHDLWVSFNKFADSSLNFQVIHWFKSTDMKVYGQGMQEMNLAIKERFDSAEISFAFPTQTVYVKRDSDWHLTSIHRTGESEQNVVSG